eukprot:14232369-Alexandrium_andersonii.AAC.1
MWAPEPQCPRCLLVRGPGQGRFALPGCWGCNWDHEFRPLFNVNQPVAWSCAIHGGPRDARNMGEGKRLL